MEKLRKLTRYYAELVDDQHQEFVGEFEYERLLYEVRKKILELERSIDFGFTPNE